MKKTDRWIHALSTGVWNGITYKPEDLKEMVGSYDPKLLKAQLVLDHSMFGQSYGSFDKVEIRKGGNELWMHLDEIDEYIEYQILDHKWPEFSILWLSEYPLPGKKYLIHGSLLGACPPGATGKEPVYIPFEIALEKEQAESLEEEEYEYTPTGDYLQQHRGVCGARLSLTIDAGSVNQKLSQKETKSMEKEEVQKMMEENNKQLLGAVKEMFHSKSETEDASKAILNAQLNTNINTQLNAWIKNGKILPAHKEKGLGQILSHLASTSISVNGKEVNAYETLCEIIENQEGHALFQQQIQSGDIPNQEMTEEQALKQLKADFGSQDLDPEEAKLLVKAQKLSKSHGISLEQASAILEIKQTA